MDNESDYKLGQLRREGWCVLERIIPRDKIRAVRAGVMASHEKAKSDYAASGGNMGRQVDLHGAPGISMIAYLSDLAPYLADERLLAVVHGIFGHHVRIAQTEFKTQEPNREDIDWRGFHSDWPHDLTDRDQAGRVAQPFPNVTMQLSVLWMISEFSPENGGTWVVPRTHRDPHNPRMHQTPEHLDEHVDQLRSIPGEIQASGPAGSALVMDSRIWHSAGANPSSEPRVAVITRYCPWWLSVEFGGRNNAVVPVSVYNALHEDVKPLYRHRAEAQDNPFTG
ncbi:MAG: hypothetical protein HOH43_01345 [Candidatus Latescibacteria bacterium]|nr:hypothetical protein [Candidatus Latescibacterota bacterium]